MNGFAKNRKCGFFNTLLQLPGIIINEVHVEESRIVVTAQTKEKYGTCPLCGKRSHRIHSVYCRTLQDLPVCAREVCMKLQIKKFVCTNPRCKKKVFSQRLPSGIRRYSRRTERAEEQLTQLSLEVSGRKGSWISKLIRIPVSPSTCLRMANKCDVPVCQGIRYIGIDDWAYRKGHTYGTILVDRETGKAVDLIKSREKEDITLWLKAHPGIETVTCDRAECYSQSADMALPGAVQITDRFHLIVNYSDCVAKISRKLLPELRKIKPERLGFDHAHDQEIQQIIDLACGRHVSQDKKGLIIKAKELYRKGYSMRRITRILQLNFRTVHKYIENDIGQIQTCRTLLIDYSSYIETLISGYRKGEKLSVVYRKRPANKLR